MFLSSENVERIQKHVGSAFFLKYERAGVKVLIHSMLLAQAPCMCKFRNTEKLKTSPLYYANKPILHCNEAHFASQNGNF